MTENHRTDSARPVKLKRRVSRPAAVLVRGEVYSRQTLLAAGFDGKRISAWKLAGLRPLDLGTCEEFFLADDIIEFGRRGAT